MLHDEVGLHAELGSFLDGEGFRFERLDGAGGGQVDGDVGAAFDLERERLDDAATVILGVYEDGRGGGNAEGGFPAVEGFVVLVWGIWSMLGQVFQRLIGDEMEFARKMEGRLQEKRGGGCLREVSQMDAANRSSTS